jgi:4-hydroxy-3-polyprenylbenzoate decarboxylase
MGFDATAKWTGETTRQWGRKIRMSEEVRARIDSLWPGLGID